MYRFALHGREISCDSVEELLAVLPAEGVQPTTPTQRARKKAKWGPKLKAARGKKMSRDGKQRVSAASVAAWRRARRYANKNGVSVSEARRILAREKRAAAR
jgi:hypothetical protein